MSFLSHNGTEYGNEVPWLKKKRGNNTFKYFFTIFCWTSRQKSKWNIGSCRSKTLDQGCKLFRPTKFWMFSSKFEKIAHFSIPNHLYLHKWSFLLAFASTLKILYNYVKKNNIINISWLYKDWKLFKPF